MVYIATIVHAEQERVGAWENHISILANIYISICL